MVSRGSMERVLLVVAIASASLIHVSIAASQMLLGVGLVLLIISRRRLEFPRLWIPLLGFFLWTLLADAVSPDPWLGRPQIRKFFVFFFIPLLYGVFRTQFDKVYWLVMGWTVAATASGLWGLWQFLEKYRHAKALGQDFYLSYLGRRITGFESHWMTFGALQLTVLSILVAQWFFSNKRMPVWAYLSVFVLSAAILLGWTRSIWLATIPAMLYLVWCWKPKMTFAVPVILVVAFFIAPASTRERVDSLFTPHGDTDSNRHRVVTFLTGVQMIKAHPWFGIGPEEVGRQFDAYMPAALLPKPTGYYGHLHNIYVQYAAERGIPGMLLMMSVIGVALFDFLKGLIRLGRQSSQQVFVLHATVAVIIGVLVGGIFEYNLGDSEVLMMFTAMIGLGYAALSPKAQTVSK